MKKLLFNKDRSKFFNLDMVISVDRFELYNTKIMLLKFSADDYFVIIPGNIKTFIDKFITDINNGNSYGLYYGGVSLAIFRNNYEENKKLYEFFEHKFTRSSLCQNTVV